jgi:hypothetical protein
VTTRELLPRLLRGCYLISASFQKISLRESVVSQRRIHRVTHWTCRLTLSSGCQHLQCVILPPPPPRPAPTLTHGHHAADCDGSNPRSRSFTRVEHFIESQIVNGWRKDYREDEEKTKAGYQHNPGPWCLYGVLGVASTLFTACHPGDNWKNRRSTLGVLLEKGLSSGRIGLHVLCNS